MGYYHCHCLSVFPRCLVCFRVAAEKELFFWLSACVVLLDAVLGVRVLFLFDVLGRMWIAIVSVPGCFFFFFFLCHSG